MEAADTMTLGMFVTLVALIMGSIWSQRRESNAIRAETTRQIERLADQFGPQLGRLSERLARIEGHLGLPASPGDTPGTSDGDDSG